MVQGKRTNSKPKFAEVVIGDNEAKEVIYCGCRTAILDEFDIHFTKNAFSLKIFGGFVEKAYLCGKIIKNEFYAYIK